MRFDFYPKQQGRQVMWARNFAQQLVNTEGHFGVSTALVGAFVSAEQAGAQAYLRAGTPETRTRGAVAAKKKALKEMERLARMIARQMWGRPEVDDAARARLGLTVPKPRRRHVPPPAVGPVVVPVKVEGPVVMVRLADAERAGSRARPDAATGAIVMRYVGENAPEPGAAWSYATESSSTRMAVAFDPALPPGTRVWICACWKNRRGEQSPWSRPVCAHLGAGVQLGPPPVRPIETRDQAA